MITLDMYSGYLNNKGSNLSEVRKKDSVMVVNATFTGDTGYKKVYLLDPNQGWIWTDAKYAQHAKQSISSDDVDYYLQFRPFEHHPVGTYVFIPNDTNPKIGFAEESPINPFKDANFEDIFKNGKLWMIVDRDNGNEFVRYMVISCNQLFKWISNYKGKKKVFNVYGMSRVISSYTAGTWEADYMRTLDTICSLWIPDTNYLFDSKIVDYELDDTRYIVHDLRLMITTNELDPKCWRVSKVNELQPRGVLKITAKEDEFDEKKDNVDLMLCNYYDEDGDVITDPIVLEEPDIEKTSIIYSASLNDNNELVKDEILSQSLIIGTTSYYIAEFSDNKVSNAEWRVSYVDITEADEKLSQERKDYYCGLIKISDFGDSIGDEITVSSISIRPSKVKQLVGKKFLLTVQNHDGEYMSSIELEVGN